MLSNFIFKKSLKWLSKELLLKGIQIILLMSTFHVYIDVY